MSFGQHMWTLLLVGAVATACSSSVAETGNGGGGAAGQGAAGGVGAGGDGAAGAGGSAGWTDCSSPSGYRVCGGPSGCALEPPECPLCLNEELAAAGGVATCVTEALAEFGSSGCFLCPDGNVCVQNRSPDGAWSCASFELAQLYERNGASERVRYVDYGLWTGDALPTPSSCPVLENVPICGGNCGGCPAGQVCTGRSRLHPYSLCIPDTVSSCEVPDRLCEEPGFGCFVFTVEPEAQAEADGTGYCLELATCQATAAELPGGGRCVLP